MHASGILRGRLGLCVKNCGSMAAVQADLDFEAGTGANIFVFHVPINWTDDDFNAHFSPLLRQAARDVPKRFRFGLIKFLFGLSQLGSSPRPFLFTQGRKCRKEEEWPRTQGLVTKRSLINRYMFPLLARTHLEAWRCFQVSPS